MTKNDHLTDLHAELSQAMKRGASEEEVGQITQRICAEMGITDEQLAQLWTTIAEYIKRGDQAGAEKYTRLFQEESRRQN